jgi:hypothetical protein
MPLSAVRRAAVAIAPALLFATALYGASSVPTTLPTSVRVTVTNTALPMTGNVGIVGSLNKMALLIFGLECSWRERMPIPELTFA